MTDAAWKAISTSLDQSGGAVESTWVLNETDLAFLREQIEMAEFVVLDVETTGLDEHSFTGGERNGGVAARVALAQFTLPIRSGDDDVDVSTWLVPLSHPDSPFLGTWRAVLTSLARTIHEVQAPLIGHNVKFDCRYIFATTGVDLAWLIKWDTRISSHMLDENRSTKLKVRAAETFGIERWDDIDLTYPGAAEDANLWALGEYGARDTYWTWRLADLHRHQMFLDHDEGHGDLGPVTPDEIEEARLGLLATYCAMPTTATLTAIEQRGIGLDVPWVKEQLIEHRRESARLSASLAGRYPGTDLTKVSWAPTAHWFRDWAEKAIAAGDLIVAELTPTGKPKWSKNVLVRQARGGNDVAVDLLALRSHTKKIEYLTSWLGYVTREGDIHAQYNAGSVVTGRLSGSEPNMQQVTATLKPAFVPRPGYVTGEFDYSQIEMRMAAHASGSIPMLTAFRNGDDMHRLFAAKINGIPAEEVSKDQRQAAKAGNFGLLFLMSAYGFRMYAESAYEVVLTEKEATAIHRAYFEMWDGLAQWHVKTIARAHATGQTVSPIGRVRRVPRIHDSSDEQVAYAERAAVNAPIQGFASDVMQIAAARIEGNIPGESSDVPEARIVATVHDSIVVELPEDDWEASARRVIDQMVNGVPLTLKRLGCDLTVPLAVEAKIGTRWGLSDLGVITG